MGKLHIDLLGTSFTIQADESTEYLEKLLDHYKKIECDISDTGVLKNPIQIAIVSGIMVCNELYKEIEKKQSQKKNSSSISIEKEEADKAEKLALEMIKKIEDVL